MMNQRSPAPGPLARRSPYSMSVAAFLLVGLSPLSAEPLSALRKGELLLKVTTDGHFTLDYKGLPLIRDASLSLSDADSWSKKTWAGLVRYGAAPAQNQDPERKSLRIIANNALCSNELSFSLGEQGLTVEIFLQVKPGAPTKYIPMELYFDRALLAGASYRAACESGTGRKTSVSGKLELAPNDPVKTGGNNFGLVIPDFSRASLDAGLGEVLLVATALVVGSSWEVFEFVFRVPYSRSFVLDTGLDLLMDAAGALALSGMLWWWRIAVSPSSAVRAASLDQTF